jgi:hypothetical protein
MEMASGMKACYGVLWEKEEFSRRRLEEFSSSLIKIENNEQS